MRIVVGFLLGAIVWTGIGAVRAEHQMSSTPYGQFVGTWTHHDGETLVQPNGYGTEHYRTFMPCTQNRTTACDRVIKNAIYAGGFIAFRLMQTRGNVAYGSVFNSSASWQVGTRLSLTLHPDGTLHMQAVGYIAISCNVPAAAKGRCGA